MTNCRKTRSNSHSPCFAITSGIFLEQSTQATSRLVAINLTRGHRHDQFLPLGSIGLRLNSVQAKKYDARAQRGSFVAIDEWMVPAKIIEIRGGHFGQIGI